MPRPPFSLLRLGLLLGLVATIASARPNVLFILADDLGWSDSTLFGTSDFYETPALERLRHQGVLFTNAHTASPICSPTRASIMTGDYPGRYGLTQARGHLPEVRLAATVAPSAPPAEPALPLVSATRLPTDAVTLAEVYHDAGYTTAYFGKWHLGNGPFGPLHQGFDLALPSDANGMIERSYFAPWGLDPAVAAELPALPGEHADDRMVRELSAYLRDRAATADDRPWFAFYGAFSIHSPWSAKADLVAKYRRKAAALGPGLQRNPVYAAMVETLDQEVGALLDVLEATGQADNTIVVFFSDNGGNTWAPPRTEPAGSEHIPGTSNAPLRAGKGSIYEGGTRVPLIIRWPGRVPVAATSDALFGSTDFFPTLLRLCDLAPPAGTARDGLDQSAVVLHPATPPVRREWFTYYPHTTGYMGVGPVAALIVDDWKLVRRFYDARDQQDLVELYHLPTDIAETSRQQNRWPERTAALSARLQELLDALGQPLPQPNPAYVGAPRP